MFKVGTQYDFRMIEAGDEVSFSGVIEAIELPLIKLRDVPALKHEAIEHETGGYTLTFVEDEGAKPHPGQIINVHSPNFVSAVERQN